MFSFKLCCFLSSTVPLQRRLVSFSPNCSPSTLTILLWPELISFNLNCSLSTSTTLLQPQPFAFNLKFSPSISAVLMQPQLFFFNLSCSPSTSAVFLQPQLASNISLSPSTHINCLTNPQWTPQTFNCPFPTSSVILLKPGKSFFKLNCSSTPTVPFTLNFPSPT